MTPTLKLTPTRSLARIRQIILFRFPRIIPSQNVFTRAFTLRNAVNTGEVIVFQRPAVGSVANPVVRYQFVDAATGRPVTNSVTLSGTRIAVLRFILPRGTFRLKITNAGTGTVAVSGAILVF